MPGCRSGMPATWSMPSRAATWWHWSTESDSIQLDADAKTRTEADKGMTPFRRRGEWWVRERDQRVMPTRVAEARPGRQSN